ncbi:MAG: hypothetical protein ABID71_08385 [Chloroflexota bacterium]
MEIFHTAAVGRIIFSLGIINIVSALLIFMSCRCISGARLLGRLRKYAWYQSLFKVHCYIWRVFWPSVIVHGFLAVLYFGVPG